MVKPVDLEVMHVMSVMMWLQCGTDVASGVQAERPGRIVCVEIHHFLPSDGFIVRRRLSVAAPKAAATGVRDSR